MVALSAVYAVLWLAISPGYEVEVEQGAIAELPVGNLSDVNEAPVSGPKIGTPEYAVRPREITRLVRAATGTDELVDNLFPLRPLSHREASRISQRLEVEHPQWAEEGMRRLAAVKGLGASIVFAGEADRLPLRRPVRAR